MLCQSATEHQQEIFDVRCIQPRGLPRHDYFCRHVGGQARLVLSFFSACFHGFLTDVKHPVQTQLKIILTYCVKFCALLYGVKLINRKAPQSPQDACRSYRAIAICLDRPRD